MVVYALNMHPVFPDPREADQDGLLAVGGDLSAERLLEAYRLGIFPWYDDRSPILWWSPDPRLVITAQTLHVPRRLQRIMRQQRFQITVDKAFAEVIEGCAGAKRRDGQGTWIIPEMQTAYRNLHQLGFAHSVEAWHDGALVGGLYGLSLGGAFFGESMFYHVPWASQAAFAALAQGLFQIGFTLIDCQQTTPHMVRLGGIELPREMFLLCLHQALRQETLQGLWHLHPERGILVHPLPKL